MSGIDWLLVAVAFTGWSGALVLALGLCSAAGRSHPAR